MKRRTRLLATALFGAGLALAQARDAAELCMIDAGALPAAGAPVLPIGNYRGPRASTDPRAQRLFEQGLVYGWGFNFAESVRSFRAAVLADRECGFCRWGIAWALGPSINHDMRGADLPVARDALIQGRIYAAPGSRERALIDALAIRYAADEPGAREAAYAEAMVALAARHVDDADLAVLAAEALMNAHPYDYWRADGRPQRWTPTIERLLERALQRAPDHPGAHHYRIHLHEDSRRPQRALDSAARLPVVAPALGHLVHMPSHLYLRVGRYHDAVVANRAANQADRDYLSLVAANPAYAASYAIHNVHFLWVAALWSGESLVASRAAAELAREGERLHAESAGAATAHHFVGAPWITDVRFARWDALLARPLPTAREAPYLAGLVHFARGVAYAARADLGAGQEELARVDAAIEAAAATGILVRNTNAAADVLKPGRWLLVAELAAAAGQTTEAIAAARRAIAAEDRLLHDEPAVWQVPARPVLARLLVAAGRGGEARSAFLGDLQRHPENAISLQGLADVERTLGRRTQAAGYARRAMAAWQHADVPLPRR